MPSGPAATEAGYKVLSLIENWRNKYETQNLSPNAHIVTQLRLHFLIYSVLRSKLFADLHCSDERFIGEKKNQILPSIVWLVSSWLSPASQIVRVIHGAYRYQLNHAIKTLFEVVAVCYDHKNHIVIEEYNLLFYCREVVKYCSRDSDGMRQFEGH